MNLLKDAVYWEIMKRLGKIVVCLASGLVLNAGARADGIVLPNNPYAPIVVRNIFGLNPTPTNNPADTADALPKIMPNGIMSIFGRLQVLFKVAIPAKAEQPAKDEAYILSEGQRQDEIEVVQIDEKAGLVTFNNHGTVQELALVKAAAPVAGTSTPAPGGPAPIRHFAAPNGENSGRGRIGGHFGGSPFGSARNPGTGNGGNNYNNGLGGGSPMTTAPTPTGFSAPTGAGYSGQSGESGQQQSQSSMTAEQAAVIIEAERQYYDSQSNPKLKSIGGIYPPTTLTPPNATGPTGNPLIISPPVP